MDSWIPDDIERPTRFGPDDYARFWDERISTAENLRRIGYWLNLADDESCTGKALSSASRKPCRMSPDEAAAAVSSFGVTASKAFVACSVMPVVPCTRNSAAMPCASAYSGPATGPITRSAVASASAIAADSAITVTAAS